VNTKIEGQLIRICTAKDSAGQVPHPRIQNRFVKRVSTIFDIGKVFVDAG
jgi:hypothetical protein